MLIACGQELRSPPPHSGSDELFTARGLTKVLKKRKPHSKIAELTPAHATLSRFFAYCSTECKKPFGAGYSAIFGAILAAKLTNFRAIARKFSREAATSSLATLLPFSRRLSSLREDKHACCFCRKNFSFFSFIHPQNCFFKANPLVIFPPSRGKN